MRIGCVDACAYFSFCYGWTKQIVAKTVIKLAEIQRDPDASQKILIVFRSVIQGINLYFHTNYLPELIQVLHVAESFDFYGFCRVPRYFFSRYIADRLDEYAILDQLEVILCHQWGMGIPDNQGNCREEQVKAFAKAQLTAVLEHMVENDLALRSEERVKTILFHQLTQTLREHPIQGFNPQNIHLDNLKIPLKQATWLEILTDATFITIDLVCVPAFLSDWSLLDLSFYANQLGKIPLLTWIPNQSVDDWIWGIMEVGYVLQFAQACHNWWKGGLTPNERKDAKLQMAASLAECVYCLVILQKKDLHYIVLCAFVAKSLGLLRFIFAPQPTFFTANNEDA